MKIVLISILVSLGSLLYSQTADIDTACAPIPIIFSPPGGHTSWFWDFKDKGATSNLEKPVHIFTNAGHYIVDFKESQNGPLIGSVLIVIYDKPVLTIATVPQYGCRPLNVSFNDLTVYKSGITPKSWLWVFGDGGADTIKSTKYTYLQAGIVTPSLEVKTNIKGCDVTQAFQDDVTIFDLPKPHFITDPEPPIACNPPLNVSFNNNSTGVEPISYKWDFGNTNTSVIKDPPSVIFSQKADYIISLTATDKNGCKNSFLDTARIGTNLICLKIRDTICFGDTLFIKNCSPVGFHNWNLGPNAQTKTSKERGPKVVFTVPGLQEIHYKLTVAGLLCELDTTIYVYVQKPDPQILSTVPNHCQAPVKINYSPVPGDFKSYTWYFGVYDSSSVKNPSFIYPKDPDNYSIFGERYLRTLLLVETYAGCKAQVIKTDTLYLLTAVIEVDTNEGRSPLTVKFSDDSYTSPKQSIVYWRWVFGDGKEFITTDNMPPVHTYDSCGLYYPYLIVENALGCRDTSYALTILVQDTLCDGGGFGGDNQGPNGPGGGIYPCKVYFSNKEICWGDTVWLSLKCFEYEEIRFISDGNRLFHCPSMDSVPWVFNHEPGFQGVSITLISKLGTVHTLLNADSIFVKGAYSRPYYMTNCANPLSVMFIDSSMNATSILWEFPGGKTYTDKLVNYKFDSTGDYLVYLTAFNDIDGCPPSKDSIWVHVRQPKALFTTIKDQYCTNDTIKLNAQLSRDVNAGCYKGYTWYFSDELRPVTTDKSSKSVIFKTPGKKIITLEVTDINGCTNTYSKEIRINEVKADFDKIDKICLPKALPLKDKSTYNSDPIDSWIWVFSNGLAVPAIQNPTIIIPENTFKPGDKVIVTLTVKNSIGCSSALSDTLTVYAPVSQIIIAPEDTFLCTGEVIDISATDYTDQGSYLKYNWDFANSKTSTKQDNKIYYQTEGIYKVNLIYTEASSGCKATATQNLHVQASPVAKFKTSTDSLIVLCQPTNVFFHNESSSKDSLTYQWDFGNNLYSTLQNPGIVYQKGKYVASLIAITSAGCADTTYQTFHIYGPEGDFNFDKNQICVGDFLTLTLKDTIDVGIWTWDFGDGIIEKGTNPAKHQYISLPPTSSTVAKLVLSDITGTCKATVEKPVPVINIIADFDALTEDSVYCVGATVQLNNKSLNADKYQWHFNTIDTSSIVSPSFNLDHAGSYTIQLIAYNTVAGCIDSINKVIKVIPFTIPALFGDTICLGDTAHIGAFKDGKGITWDWNPKSDLLKPDAYQTGAIPKTTTSYTVKAIQQPGCEATGEVEVTVIQPYVGSLSWDTAVVKGAGIKLSIPKLGPGYSYSWVPATGLSCNLCPNPIFVADSTIVYKLIITDDNKCFDTEIRFTILVNPDKIDLPNVFTPNGDGKNDYFQIYVINGNIGDIGVLQFKVYSRWGQKVYDNGDVTKGWDGTFRGRPCPSDIYVYVIEVGYFNGKQEIYRGEITLVR